MTELTNLSETDSANTSISGTNIAEGCNPSDVNNGMRATLGLIRRAFKASIFRIRDTTNQTKLLAFDLSNITGSTTRTITVPDRDLTLGTADSATSSTVPTMTFLGDTDTGFGRSAANTIVTITDGVSRDSLDGSGNRRSTIPSGTTLLPDFPIRAWAYFDGTATGTNAPTAGGNISSITRTGTGIYTATLTTGMPDTNYLISGSARVSGSAGAFLPRPDTTLTTGTFGFQTLNVLGNAADAQFVYVFIIR